MDPNTKTQPRRPDWTRAGRLGLGLLLGAGLGYAYYTLVGCSTGGCPITSDPIVSSSYGALIGGFLFAGL
jgi:hypothetical protein